MFNILPDKTNYLFFVNRNFYSEVQFQYLDRNKLTYICLIYRMQLLLYIRKAVMCRVATLPEKTWNFINFEKNLEFFQF